MQIRDFLIGEVARFPMECSGITSFYSLLLWFDVPLEESQPSTKPLPSGEEEKIVRRYCQKLYVQRE
jgi:hypothetical protein